MDTEHVKCHDKIVLSKRGSALNCNLKSGDWRMPSVKCPNCNAGKLRCNGFCTGGRLICPTCRGSGGCSTCSHTGTIPCASCGGSGQIVCSRCGGSGLVSA